MRTMKRCLFKICSEIRPAKPKFKDKPKAKVDIFQGYTHGNVEIIQGYIHGNNTIFLDLCMILGIYPGETRFIGGFFHDEIACIHALNYVFPWVLP